MSEASSLESVSEVIQSDNSSSDHDMVSLSGSLSSVSVFGDNHHSFIMHEQEDSISEPVEHISSSLNSDSDDANSNSNDLNSNSNDNNIMQHSAYEISDSFSSSEEQLNSDVS